MRSSAASDVYKRQGLEGQDFRYRGRGPYRLSLLGSYQLSNAITALEVVQALRDAGWTIPEEAAARGLAAAQWPGRLELARRSPDFIVDGGHNPQCVDALAAVPFGGGERGKALRRGKRPGGSAGGRGRAAPGSAGSGPPPCR